MVRVAALGVGRRRTTLTVLLCRQVLTAGCGRRRERLGIVVEVTGVALSCGSGFEGHPAPWCVVTVAHVSAAGGGGRGKVSVCVWPVAVGSMC